MIPKKLFLIILLTSLSFGCGTGEKAKPKPIREAEIKLGTESEKLDYYFHPVIEDIRGLGLQFPGFIIGIEKTDRRKIGLYKLKEIEAEFEESGLQLQPGHDSEYSNKRIHKILNDSKRTFVSHIVEYISDNQSALPRIKANDPIFNLYTHPLLINTQQDHKLNYNHSHDKRIFDISRESITTLLSQRLQDIVNNFGEQKPYTHVIVCSMGWNTGQRESIENFNSIMGHLFDSFESQNDRNFKPIFIGLTWPSTWSFGSGIWNDTKRGLSVLNKGNDADEIGLIWANILINDVIRKIKKEQGLKIVLIGHSYGARLLSRAIFSCNLLKGKECDYDTVDLFVGLQSAFSKSRFSQLKDSDRGEYLWLTMTAEKLWFNREGIPFTNYNINNNVKIVLLWSKYDTATSRLNFAGGNNLIELSKAHPHNAIFEHCTYENLGNCLSSNLDDNKVLLIDASSVVFNDLPLHGGGAHSDIYKKEIGQILNILIKRFAI